MLFATEKARSFEAATDMATDAIRMQLKKFKTKIKNGRAKTFQIKTKKKPPQR
jgi:putative sigma-54 modulation protein